MKNKKIKLSLIDDYVHIFLIKNFLNNSFYEMENQLNCIDLIKSTQQLDCFLEKEYLKIIHQLKLDDTSFSVLQNELMTNNSLFLKLKKDNFLSLESTLKLINIKLNSILNDYKIKLNKLKIFPFANN